MKFMILVVYSYCLIKYSTGLNLRAIAEKWAPLVVLAKYENFRPLSVDFYLKHVKLVQGESQYQLNSTYLPECRRDCYLETIEKLPSPESDKLKMFFGQEFNGAPTYAIVRRSVTGFLMTIKYWFFYPYNRGKRVCIGFFINGYCIGHEKIFGNHVGDWENIEVKFTSTVTPHSIGYSAHGVLRWYLYDGSKFQHESGEVLDFSGTHPVVYSALGSHGAWFRPGRHVYRTFPALKLELVDETSNGTQWKTWRNLRVIKSKAKGQFTGSESFLNFQGRWGNRKNGCGLKSIYELISGECILSDGPTGPF